MNGDATVVQARLDQLNRAVAAGDATWDESTDVIVVGAGLAGYCAALTAAEAGRQVLLLEKQSAAGGSTVLSGGAMAFAGTDEQKAAGVEDSNERLFEDLRNVGAQRNDERLVRAYVENQLDTYRWLKQHDVEFRSVQLGGGQSVPRSNRVATRQVIAALAACAQRMPTLKIRFDARVVALVGDRSVGVAGVLLQRADGSRVSVAARLGVVLTSGGFSRSEAMLAQYASGQERSLRIGGPGNTGDGFRMARDLGASLRDMEFIKGTFGMHPSAGPEDLKLVHAIYKGGIIVNKRAERFVDESISYKLIGDACLAQPDAMGYQIFDQAIMDLSVAGVATSDFADAFAKGLLFKCDTLAELAAAAGLPAERLSATVQRYNDDVTTRGVDQQFGRDGLGNHYGALRPIARAPFYAYPSTTAVLATYGGLAFDADTRVLDESGQPIRGLFAAGEITGGFHGAAYMTGSSLGKSAIFGRIAGRNVAAGAATAPAGPA